MRRQEFSYVDGTSFGLMERLEIGQAFSCDPHFEQYGLELSAESSYLDGVTP